MIDLRDLRENPETYRASQRARGADETLVDRIIEAVYQDVDARLDPAARINIQAQLEYLAQSGKLPS